MGQETLDKMVDRVQEMASAFKEIEDKGKVAFTIIMGILGLGLLFTALSKD